MTVDYVVGEYYWINHWPKRCIGLFNDGKPYFFGFESSMNEIDSKPLTDDELLAFALQVVNINSAENVDLVISNYKSMGSTRIVTALELARKAVK